MILVTLDHAIYGERGLAIEGGRTLFIWTFQNAIPRQSPFRCPKPAMWWVPLKRLKRFCFGILPDL